MKLGGLLLSMKQSYVRYAQRNSSPLYRKQNAEEEEDAARVEFTES
jgi:hypothetical protein